MDLENLIKEHLEFTTKTFPKGTSRGALLHCKKEIQEIIDDIDNNAPRENRVVEYADALGCFTDSYNRGGITLSEIIEAWYNKLQINKVRKWKDNGDGSYSHIKE